MNITLANIRATLLNFTKEELTELNRELVDIIKHKRASASHEAIQGFSVRDQVSYKDSCGTLRKGHITKINRTRIVVQPKHQSRQVSVPAHWLNKLPPTFDPTKGEWE